MLKESLNIKNEKTVHLHNIYIMFKTVSPNLLDLDSRSRTPLGASRLSSKSQRKATAAFKKHPENSLTFLIYLTNGFTLS